MDSHLKEINAVFGVIGSMICLPDGNIAAKAMPDKFDAANLQAAARVASQTFQALDSSGQRVNDVDLSYEKGRLILKNLRGGGILAIVCRRTINLPLLNLTANAVVKKLTAELKPKPVVSPTRQPVVVPAPSPKPKAQPTVPAPIPLPPVIAELEQEIHRIIEKATSSRVRLRAMGVVASWLKCQNHRPMLTLPEGKQIELAGFLAERDSIESLCGQLGYQNNRRFNAFYGNRRLNFSDPKLLITIDVHLDNYEMYHKLDLTSFLTQEDFLLPITAVLLSRLQTVEMTDNLLCEICALMLDHDLSLGLEKGKIDVSYITRLCTEDWGWFKTVSTNLDRLATMANAHLPPTEKEIIVERAQRLKHSIASAPKGLRWQARARLGESARWYETPLVYRPNAVRPDMAIG
jgi:predicted regulator of Ras-like GTPase activity (Roadblock/LC7/MglB family)